MLYPSELVFSRKYQVYIFISVIHCGFSVVIKDVLFLICAAKYKRFQLPFTGISLQALCCFGNCFVGTPA
jgi:uncharacterized membrane protein YagU involved in acid resistance